MGKDPVFDCMLAEVTPDMYLITYTYNVFSLPRCNE
jgi:hypothetical protein